MAQWSKILKPKFLNRRIINRNLGFVELTEISIRINYLILFSILKEFLIIKNEYADYKS